MVKSVGGVLVTDIEAIQSQIGRDWGKPKPQTSWGVPAFGILSCVWSAAAMNARCKHLDRLRIFLNLDL